MESVCSVWAPKNCTPAGNHPEQIQFKETKMIEGKELNIADTVILEDVAALKASIHHVPDNVSDRDVVMVIDRLCGAKLSEIGHKYGITAQAVHAALKRPQVREFMREVRFRFNDVLASYMESSALRVLRSIDDAVIEGAGLYHRVQAADKLLARSEDLRATAPGPERYMDPAEKQRKIDSAIAAITQSPNAA